MHSMPAKMDVEESARRDGTPFLEKPAGKAKASAGSGPPTVGGPSKLPTPQQTPVPDDCSACDQTECAEKQQKMIQQYMDEHMTRFVGGVVTKTTAQMGADVKRMETAQTKMQESVQGVSDHVHAVETRVQEMGTSIDQYFDDLPRMMEDVTKIKDAPMWGEAGEPRRELTVLPEAVQHWHSSGLAAGKPCRRGGFSNLVGTVPHGTAST